MSTTDKNRDGRHSHPQKDGDTSKSQGDANKKNAAPADADEGRKSGAAKDDSNQGGANDKR